MLRAHKWLGLRWLGAFPFPCQAAGKRLGSRCSEAQQLSCIPLARCARRAPSPHVLCSFLKEPRLVSGLPKAAPVSKGSVPLHLCNNEKPNNQSPRTRSGQPLLNHRGRGGHRWEPVAATAPKLIRYLTSLAELARQALHSEQAGRTN